MSHFYHIVLMHKGVAPIQGEVDRLMEPFDEAIKVDPYEVQCSCVGFLAEVEADKQAQEAVGAVEDIRANFWKTYTISHKQISRARRLIKGGKKLSAHTKKQENYF